MGNCQSVKHYHHHAHHVPVLDHDADAADNKKKQGGGGGVNRHHAAAAAAAAANKNNNKKYNNIRGGGGGGDADATDSTESERDNNETNTLPLTPQSNEPAAAVDDDNHDNDDDDNHYYDNEKHSPEQETPSSPLSSLSLQPPKVSSPSSRYTNNNINNFLGSSSTFSRSSSRALKARLEKSRSIQASFSRQSLESNNNNTAAAAGAGAASNDWSNDETTISSSSSSVVAAANSLYRYSLVSLDQQETQSTESPKNNEDKDDDDESNKLKNEFDASISQGTVWAEFVDHHHDGLMASHNNSNNSNNNNNNNKVLAVTLSCQTPTLSQTSPPLFLGVGTELGTVSVVELLDDSSPSSCSAATAAKVGGIQQQREQQNCHRRLGKVMQFQCEGRIRSLDFSPDGQYLAVGGDDCICTVLKLVYNSNNNSHSHRNSNNTPPNIKQNNNKNNKNNNTGSLAQLEICAELERVDRVFAVKFSPDAKYLAIGGYDGAVAIATTQDIAESYTPDLVTEISCDGLVFALDWSADGQYLAFGGSDRVCSIVNTHMSWRVAHRIRRPAVIKTLQWNLFDKRLLAIGSSDVALVEAPDFVVSEELEIPLTVGVARTVARINALCWSPNGSYLVVCDSTNKCRVMETKSFVTVQEIRRSGGEINAVHWGQQAVIGGIPRRYLVIGDNEKVALLKAGIEMNDGASALGDEISSSMASSFYGTCCTRDDGPTGRSGEWVLQENAFRDMDGDLSFSASNNKKNNNNPETTIKVLAVTFSRGSRSKGSTYFAYSTDDGLVTVKSPNGWKTMAELRFPQPVTTMFFSNGSRYLAFGCQDSKIYVSGTAPRWSLLATTKLSSPPRAVAFSKDNQFLAAGCNDGTLALLNSKKHYQVAGTLFDDNISESSVTAVDWCSKTLAIGRNNGIVQLYDTNKVTSGYYGSQAAVKRHSQIRSIVFGLSGRFLAVGTEDGVVGIYSAKGGWVLCHQLRFNVGITSLRWSPTCSFLAVSNNKEDVKVMDTVFWQNVEEASKVFATGQEAKSTMPPTSSLGPSCMCFSQDGKHLALAQSHSGLTVVDTLDWKLAFTLNDERQKDSDNTSYSSFDIPEEHPVN